jgi:valyl-tRNA synthetase
MEKAFEATTCDPKWQKFWEERGLFRPEEVSKRHAKPTGKPYTIVMPPPNVTGVLHQGHALMLALEDTLTRWRRMCGDDALYLPGTDHASIAVQMQVVKHLESKGVNYREIGREAFLKECWKWIEEYQPRIYAQIRLMGTSCDWSRVKFTMDPVLNRAVTKAFVELHKKGLIYRAERLVNWSPKGQTVLSDLEVLMEERDGSLWHLRYPVVGTNEFLVVATTRPETMLGDTGVAVHPDDERYRKFIGKKVRLPFTDREIPIVGDTFVDKDFGSGVVKVTPAHDFTDFEVGQRNKLPMINVFTPDAKIVAGLPGEAASFAGLDRFKAREKIVALLEERGLLEKIEKYKVRLGVSERHKDVVEPFLSYQWYVKMDTMAARAAKSVLSGEIEIVPGEFKNQFLRWMENIRDWCISRQLWWGQQIPAYHCQKCSHIEVAETAPAVCPKCGGPVEQDKDVLDTWFSSGLWPFSTLGWPDVNAADFKKFYPNQVMETGFDILFFWVARMITMGQELTGKSPFTKVYLHPMVRDEHGQKMSKTKGNTKDPLDIVQLHGTDTLRFTLNALCVQGRDLRLSEERIESYRHFINKVWNASRFVLAESASQVDLGASSGADWRPRPRPVHLHDRWILSRLDATARDVAKAWSEFRMQEAAETIYHFVWSDYCDWYIECAKATRAESRPVLLHVLSEILKLLHPLCPHVTEEIWHALPGVKADDTILFETFPAGDAFPDSDALAEFKFLQDAVVALRNLRAEAKVPPSKKIPVSISGVAAASNTARVLKGCETMIAQLARAEFSASAPSGATTKVVVSALEAGTSVEFVLPLGELVDLGEERARLQKEIEGLTKIVASQESKLSNESFVARAPAEVIDKERLKLSEARDKIARMKATLESLGGK